MGSVSSEDGCDQQSERCGSYCVSADVSESESSSDFPSHHYHYGEASPSTCPTSFVSASAFRCSGLLEKTALLPVVGEGDLVVWKEKAEKRDLDFSEVEMMKERFAKLLLGEDMSGGGKGVCTALAISNAITNLSATVFAELWKLEPLPIQKKAMWRREMEWLLSVGDSIVELIPSIQDFPGGGTFEVMVTRPRSDLYVNLPALKTLDALLLGMLDGFRDTEFQYVDRGFLVADGDEDSGSGSCPSSSLGRPSVRQEDKWWLPYPCVPSPNGLSEETRNRLQKCRDLANQIHKAAMDINSWVLSQMEIPDIYYESLPKNGKSCLGEIIYRYITADCLPECILDCLDLSSEHHTLDVANRIEAALHVWRQKDRKHSPHAKVKKSWGGRVKKLVGDAERSHSLAERAEGLLWSLRLRYPGLPQTVLDMNKIQYNKDVGLSILESYSRVIESLAFNLMARIDDLIYVDDAKKRCAAAESVSLFNRGGLGGLPIQKKISPSPFSLRNTPYASPFATPTFCSSTPISGSPGRDHPILSKGNLHGRLDVQFGKVGLADIEKVWSYTGNLSSRKDYKDAPERD